MSILSANLSSFTRNKDLITKGCFIDGQTDRHYCCPWLDPQTFQEHRGQSLCLEASSWAAALDNENCTPSVGTLFKPIGVRGHLSQHAHYLVPINTLSLLVSWPGLPGLGQGLLSTGDFSNASGNSNIALKPWAKGTNDLQGEELLTCRGRSYRPPHRSWTGCRTVGAFTWTCSVKAFRSSVKDL